MPNLDHRPSRLIRTPICAVTHNKLGEGGEKKGGGISDLISCSYGGIHYLSNTSNVLENSNPRLLNLDKKGHRQTLIRPSRSVCVSLSLALCLSSARARALSLQELLQASFVPAHWEFTKPRRCALLPR